MMELTPEDNLRLNVMLANADVVRIDEGAMIVYGLSNGQESKIKLHATGRKEDYLKKVRETLSIIATGSPKGYPAHLRRWVRMGEMTNISPEKLLLLGEPEAVVAISGMSNLSDELASRAWWASPTSENARRMLQSEQVVQGEMGKVLADFLIEFLPFEEDGSATLETVRLVLQKDLVDEKARKRLWEMGSRKKAYRVGFLHAMPDNLPMETTQRADYAVIEDSLLALSREGNATAQLLIRVASAGGQAFLKTCEDVMKRPGDQDVVVSLVEAIKLFFAPCNYCVGSWTDIEEMHRCVDEFFEHCCSLKENQEILEVSPELKSDLYALLALGQVQEKVVWPVLSRTTAVGSLLRKKLEPIMKSIIVHLHELQQASVK